MKAENPKNKDVDPFLKDFGFIYIPDQCKDKQCNLLLDLHGCGGQATRRSSSTGPYAPGNDLVVVFPQSFECWDYFNYYIGDNWLEGDSLLMQYMKRVVERVSG